MRSPFSPTAPGASCTQGTSKERGAPQIPAGPSQRGCFLALPLSALHPPRLWNTVLRLGRGGTSRGDLVLGRAALGQRCWEGPGPRRLQSQQRFPGEPEGLAQLPGGPGSGLLAAAGGQRGGGGCLLPSLLRHNLLNCCHPTNEKWLILMPEGSMMGGGCAERRMCSGPWGRAWLPLCLWVSDPSSPTPPLLGQRKLS